MASIGEQIRDARKAKGLTQDALAEAMHVSRSSVANWENGRRIPDGEMLLHISKILGYNFTADGEFRQSTESADGDTAPGTPDAVPGIPISSVPKPNCGHSRAFRGVLIALIAAAALFACWFFILRDNNTAAVYTAEDGSSYTIAQFRQPAENIQGKAYLRLEPSVQVTEGENYKYWMYTMAMYEENGVALSVDRVEEYIFGDKSLVRRTYGAGDIQAYGVSLDIAPLGEWSFSGGFPVQNIRGLGMKVYCTDEGGASLCFTGYLPLAEE